MSLKSPLARLFFEYHSKKKNKWSQTPLFASPDQNCRRASRNARSCGIMNFASCQEGLMVASKTTLKKFFETNDLHAKPIGMNTPHAKMV